MHSGGTARHCVDYSFKSDHYRSGEEPDREQSIVVEVQLPNGLATLLGTLG
jgi:hypothetical protein